MTRARAITVTCRILRPIKAIVFIALWNGFAWLFLRVCVCMCVCASTGNSGNSIPFVARFQTAHECLHTTHKKSKDFKLLHERLVGTYMFLAVEVTTFSIVKSNGTKCLFLQSMNRSAILNSITFSLSSFPCPYIRGLDSLSDWRTVSLSLTKRKSGK